LPPREPESVTFSVVVRTAQGAISLRMDGIDDVLELDVSSFEHPPRNVDAHLRGLLLGVYQLPHRLLLILDIHRTVAGENDYANAH
jgi:purine-binding chemotaxis protein CheW